MLTHEEVLKLNEEFSDQKVLSVYVNAEETDPAERRAWRIRLNGKLKALEERVKEESPGEISDLRAAIELLEEELKEYPGMLPERGWVLYASADQVHYAGSTPAPMPDLVRWENGSHVAPYVRALKQARPVTVVVADQRKAKVFTYIYGEMKEENEFTSDVNVAEGAAARSSGRAGTHSGQRGEPASDAAQRAAEVSTNRMLRELVDFISGPVQNGNLLVLGGNSETLSALQRHLPDRAKEKTIEISSLAVDASPAQLKEAVDGAASELSLRLQKALVDEIIETDRSDGRACVGQERTERALRAGAVDTLVISRNFNRARPDLAEEFVDLAFEQGGTVEQISEDASTELDLGGGIGARLRFTV